MEELCRLHSFGRGAPTGLIIGDRTGYFQRELLLIRGLSFLSCNLEGSTNFDLPSFQGDFALLTISEMWPDGVLFLPPCAHSTCSDPSLAMKIADGRTYWELVQFVCALCLLSRFTLAVHFDSLASVFLSPLSLTLDTLYSSEEEARPPELLIRESALLESLSLACSGDAKRCVRHPSKVSPSFQQANSSDLSALYRALISWWPITSAAPVSLDQERQLELFAVRWHLAGNHVPRGYRFPRGAAPLYSRAYQGTVGSGDGRVIDAVCPFALLVPPVISDIADQRPNALPELALIAVAALVALSSSNAPAINFLASEATLLRPSGYVSLFAELEVEYLRRSSLYSHSDTSVVKSQLEEEALTLEREDHLAASFNLSASCILVSALTSQMVVLFAVALAQVPLVLTNADGVSLIAAEVPISAVDQGLKSAMTLLTLTVAASLTVVPVGRFKDGPSLLALPVPPSFPNGVVARTRSERLAACSSGKKFIWCTLAALAGCAVSPLVERALIGTVGFTRPVLLLASELTDMTDSFGEFFTGRAPLQPVTRHFEISGLPAIPLNTAAREAWGAEEMLRSSLMEATGPMAPDLQAWASRIAPLDLSVVPLDLHDRLPSFGSARLASVPFGPVYVPVRTTWLDKEPPRQLRRAPGCPRSFLELIAVSATRQAAEKWMRDEHRDLLYMLAHPNATLGERRRPHTLVIGQLELYPWARGDIWDCSLTSDTCCVIHDTSLPIESHLNLQGLSTRLSAYPDQRMLSNILEGVRLEADIELQAVFMPHLDSLPPGFAAVNRELKRLSALGWYDVYKSLPLFPCYLNGQGSVPRKKEADRHRRTTEAGGPRQDIFDSSGLRVLSLNEASRLFHMPQHYMSRVIDGTPAQRTSYASWLSSKGLPPSARYSNSARAEQLKVLKYPLEVKPLVGSLVQDLAPLRHAASVLGEPLYIFNDDAKDFFNQLKLSREDYHKLCVAWLDLDFDSAETARPPGSSPPLRIIAERVLGFGCASATNVAQRFAESLLFLFRSDFDQEEKDYLCEDCDPRASFDAWRSARVKLSPAHQTFIDANGEEQVLPGSAQLRLYTSFIYTDDFVFVAVGVSRAIRMLRAWKRHTDWLRLIMAIPIKRALGTWTEWLGVTIATQMGLILVPPPKLIRASLSLDSALLGALTFDQYRSLVGLLEHFRSILGEARNIMYGLYRPHDPETGAAATGPSTIVAPCVLMVKQLRAWSARLTRCAGITILEKRSGAVRAAGASIVITSDAANDATYSGIGGYCYGYYWHYKLSPQEALTTHITLLEFLALAVSIIVFTRHVSRFSRVVLLTDALATAYTLARGKERSENLRVCHELLMKTAGFKAVAPRADVGHLSGVLNIPADLVSRGRFADLEDLALQLRVELNFIEITDPEFVDALCLIRATLARKRKRRPPRASPVLPLNPGNCDPACAGGPAHRFAAIYVTPADGQATLLAPDVRRDYSVLLLHYDRTGAAPQWVLRLFSAGFLAGSSLPITSVCATLGFGISETVEGIAWYPYLIHAESLALRQVVPSVPAQFGVYAAMQLGGRNTRIDGGTAVRATDDIVAYYGGAAHVITNTESLARNVARLHRYHHGHNPFLLETGDDHSGYVIYDGTGGNPHEGAHYINDARGTSLPHNATFVRDGTCRVLAGFIIPALRSHMTLRQCLFSEVLVDYGDVFWNMAAELVRRMNSTRALDSAERHSSMGKNAMGSHNPNADGSPRAHDWLSTYVGTLEHDKLAVEVVETAPWLAQFAADMRAESAPSLTPILAATVRTSIFTHEPAPPREPAIASPIEMDGRLQIRAPQTEAGATLAFTTTSLGLEFLAPHSNFKAKDATLHEACMQASRNKASDLITDETPGHLNCARELLEHYTQVNSAWKDYGVNANTHSMDVTAWNRWDRFCRIVIMTSPIREQLMMVQNPDRETEILAWFDLWLYPQLEARDPSRKWAKPAASLQNVQAIRRVHQRWGIAMPRLALIRAAAHGRFRAFINFYGPHSMAPRRKEPWLLCMTATLKSIELGTKIGNKLWDPFSDLAFLVFAMMDFLFCTGFRLAALLEHSSGEVMCFMRSHVVFQINAVSNVPLTNPTALELRRMRIGDIITALAPRGKSDAWGEIHCPFPVPIAFNSPAGQALIANELRFPLRADKRKHTPLFTRDGNRAFNHGFLDPLLRALLTVKFGADCAMRYSWHSFRIGLACALRATNCPSAVTMLICQWLSEKSLLNYSRKGVDEHLSYIAAALEAKVDSQQAASILLANPQMRLDVGDAYATYVAEADVEADPLRLTFSDKPEPEKKRRGRGKGKKTLEREAETKAQKAATRREFSPTARRAAHGRSPRGAPQVSPHEHPIDWVAAGMPAHALDLSGPSSERMPDTA